MDIQYFGANCIRISTKKATVVIDDNLAEVGLSAITKDGDVVLRTFGDDTAKKKPKIVIAGPGEFEVSDVSIKGVAARAHMDQEKEKTTTMYKLDIQDVRIAIVGHVFPDLHEDEVEEMGTIDVLIVPVGNSGYTLDGVGAAKVIRTLEPKLVIPTHYEDKAVKYEVPQQSLEEALKDLPFEKQEPVSKLKLKTTDIPEKVELVVLERS